jgi:hypothetical protein
MSGVREAGSAMADFACSQCQISARLLGEMTAWLLFAQVNPFDGIRVRLCSRQAA